MLSLKLLSIINNDAHITGSRNLEGIAFSETTSFLNSFIQIAKENAALLPAELLDIVEQKRLAEKLTAMLSIDKKLTQLVSDLSKFPETQREQGYRDALKPIAQDIQKLEIKTDESLLFPGGWTGKPSGHAMVYEFKRDQNGDLLFLIYNSGAGLNYHVSANTKDKDKYSPIKAYRIPKNEATVDNLSYYLTELTKAQTEFNIPSNVPKNIKYDEHRLYQEIFPKIAYLGGVEIPLTELEKRFQEVVTIGQRSGTCAEKSLHQVIKSAMPDDDKAKLFLFYFKKYSIEKFYNENKDEMDNKKAEQLLLAIENLIRGMEKKPSLFTDESLQNTYTKMREIKDKIIALKPEPQKKNIVIPIDGKIQNQTRITTLQTETPLQAKVDSKNTDKTPFFPEIDSDKILTLPFSQTAFDELTAEIRLMMRMNNKICAQRSIEQLLLNLPLDKAFYQSITTPEQGAQLIKALSDLLSSYGQCAQINDPQNKFKPKSIVTLLSAVAIINEITCLDNTATTKTLNPFLGNDFSSLCRIIQNNPLLGSQDPLVNARLVALTDRVQDTARTTTYYHNYKKKTERFGYYQTFLEKHKQSTQLNDFLLTLFNQAAKPKFTEDEIQVIRNKKLESVIAMLELLDKIPENLQSQANALNIKDIHEKIKFERMCEQTCDQVFSTLNTLSYNFLINTVNNENKITKIDSKAGAVYYESLLDFWIKINEKHGQGKTNNPEISAPLNMEYGQNRLEKITEVFDQNAIYCDLKHVEKIDKGEINKATLLETMHKRMLWQLRSTPNSQILNTLDYFKANPEMVKDNDLIVYLHANIFQPGLITKGLQFNPAFFNQVNSFCDFMINYAQQRNDANALKAMIDLKYQFNTYALTTKESHYKDQALKELLKLKEITTKDDNALLAIDLQIAIQLYTYQESEPKEPLLETMLSKYLQLQGEIKVAPERKDDIEKLDDIKAALLNILFNNQDKLEHLVTNWLASKNITPQGKFELAFPQVMVKDQNGNIALGLDLAAGDLNINGEMLSMLPTNLRNSELYTSFIKDDKATVKANWVSYDRTGAHKRFKVSTPGQEVYYFETKHLSQPYVLHMPKSINGKTLYCELYALTDSQSAVNKTSLFGAREIKANLPQSFFDANTAIWRTLESPATLIERKDDKYLLDQEGKLWELNQEGLSTGYQLLHYRSSLFNPGIKSLYSALSQFEDSSMIEIFTKADAPIKINLPRYGLHLAANFDDKTQQWKITDSQFPERVLLQSQTSPIVGYEAPLLFEDQKTQEAIAYVPLQEFYVKPKSDEKPVRLAKSSGSSKKGSFHQGGDESSFATVYYHLDVDLENQAKRRLIGEIVDDKDSSKAIKSLVPKGPWEYLNQESFLSIPYDVISKQFKPVDHQQRLYLAYVHLCQHQPEKAFSLLQDIIQGGGLTGTVDELSCIEKIINGVPRFPSDAKINNPSLLGVKMQALSLLTHFHAKGHTIKINATPSSHEESKTAHYAQNVNERLDEFQKNSTECIRAILNDYHHTRRNIPVALQLSLQQEYELLHKLFGKTKEKSGPLGARYLELKAQFLMREKAQIPESAERAQKIDSKLNKNKVIMLNASKLQTKDIFISPKPKYAHLSQDLSLRELVFALKSPKKELILPAPGISDTDFALQIANYFKIASLEDSKEKEQLKQFCTRSLMAGSALATDKSHSLIYDFSTLLLIVMKSPEIFKDTKIDELDKLFNIASKGSVSIPIQRNSTAAKIINFQPSVDKIKQAKSQKIAADEFTYPQYDNDTFITDAKMTDVVLEVRAVEQERDQEIKKLIEEKYPINLAFEEHQKQISILDTQIANLQNSYQHKINDIVRSKLQNQEFRDLILEKTKACLPEIQKTLKEVTDNIVDLARRGPSNLQEQLVFQLQQLGKTRKTLELSDLHRLFVLADLNEYRQATGLSDDDIQKLHQQIADYVQLTILQQQFTRRESALLTTQQAALDRDTEKFNQSIGELGKALLANNVCDFATEPELQFFQMAQSILIYPGQREYINKLLKNEAKNDIVKAMMGGGKSKVLAPLLNVCKANGEDLVIYQVKKGLLQTNYQDINQTSLALFNKEAIPFAFDRNKPSRSADFKSIYDLFHKTIVNKNFLITCGESLSALELKYVEILLDKPDSTNEAQLKEWRRQVKWLDKSLQLLKSKGVRLIDEVHDELEPKKRLNYTIGKPKAVLQEDILRQVRFFEFIKDIKINDNIPMEDILRNKHQIQTQTEWDELFKSLAKEIAFNPNSPIESLLAKMQLNKEDKNDLIEYLLNKSDKSLTHINRLSTQEKDDIAFLKIQLSEILPHTIKRNLFEHYGPSFIPKSNFVDKLLPIPYSDNNTPNENSEFGHFVENMNYTMQMAYQIDFSDEFVNSIIDNFLNDAELEMLESSTLAFNKTLACLYFTDQFGLDLQKIKQEPDYRKSVLGQCKKSPQFMYYALEKQILGKISMNPTVISSNPVNQVSITKSTQGMSGTPSNVRAMHRNFRYDEKQGLGIDGRTTALIERGDKTSAQAITSFKTTHELMAQIKNENFRAIIDVGALFKGVTNEQVAQDIADFYKEKIDNKMKYVLYWDTKDKILHALDIKNNKTILLNSSDEKKIAAILKCTPDERFTYYSQAETTGMDVVQAEFAHAVVTIGKESTQSKLYQGCRRMRRWDEGQTNGFIYLNTMQNYPAFKNNDPLEIAEYTRLNEINQLLDIHLSGAMQNFHDIVRENLLSKIYAIAAPDMKAVAMQAFKQYFESEFQPNHFLHSGQVTTKIEAKTYFENMEKHYFDSWKKTLQSASFSISDSESEKIKEALSEVKTQALNNCAALIENNANNAELGNKVEVENNTKIETNVATETKLAIDLNTSQFTLKKSVKPHHSWGDSPSDIVRSLKNFTLRMKFQNILTEAPSLSPHLHVTESFAQTYDKQRSYFDIYTKPIEMIMMVAKKKAPYDTQAIILNKHEADSSLIQELKENDLDIWFVSPSGSVLGGTPPIDYPKDSIELLEQIRYLNGDCKLLCGQKETLSWVDDEKLSFFEKHILPIHPDQSDAYPKLCTRVSVINKIMKYIIEHPDTDCRTMDWEKQFAGFDKTKEQSKINIQQLAYAFYTLNHLPQEKLSENWLAQFPIEIVPFVKTRMAQTNLKHRVLNGLENGVPLSEICKNVPASIIDFNFTDKNGDSPLHLAIKSQNLNNIDFILQHDFQINQLDAQGKTVIENILEIEKSNPELVKKMLKILILNSQYLDQETQREQLMKQIIQHASRENIIQVLEWYAMLDINLIYTSKPISFWLHDKSISADDLPVSRALSNLEKIISSQDWNILDFWKSQDLDSMVSTDDLNFYKTKQGQSLLHLVVDNIHRPGAVSLAKKLLEMGMDANILDHNNLTPLALAITPNAKLELIELLLEYGANPNIPYHDQLPLEHVL